MSALPTDIRQAGPDRLEIEWKDGTVTRYAVRELRLACPCADCVDELSGQRRLDPATVADDIRPLRITSVGRYALSIVWSDGHETGIYSFERLKKLGKTA